MNVLYEDGMRYLPRYEPGELDALYQQLCCQRKGRKIKNIHLICKIICGLGSIAVTTVKVTCPHAFIAQEILCGIVFASGVGIIWTHVKRKNLEQGSDLTEDTPITEEGELT